MVLREHIKCINLTVTPLRVSLASWPRQDKPGNVFAYHRHTREDLRILDRPLPLRHALRNRKIPEEFRTHQPVIGLLLAPHMNRGDLIGIG